METEEYFEKVMQDYKQNRDEWGQPQQVIAKGQTINMDFKQTVSLIREENLLFSC